VNKHDVRLIEECLYVRKYLRPRIKVLNNILKYMLPQLPGSVLKMVGKPVAKNPFDTSITERYGISRAECDEAIELSAKMILYNSLLIVKSMPDPDYTFVKYKYDKEYSTGKVKDLMQLDHIQYNTIRIRVLRKVWERIRGIDEIELALL